MKKSTITSILSMLIICFFSFQPLQAATYTVTNMADSGSGSLRQAIIDANNNIGPDIIDFNINIGGLLTFMPFSQYPSLTDQNGVTIDGYTQPGAQANTQPQGMPSDAILLIQINGGNIPAADGIYISTWRNTIRGIVVNGFNHGIVIDGSLDNAQGNAIEGCYIGTNSAGTFAIPNSQSGVAIINAAGVGLMGNNIGDGTPGGRCLISGNQNGITIDGAGTTATGVFGNYIGTNVNGNAAIANWDNGILISNGASNSMIGSTTSASRNIISGNTYGIVISGAGTSNNTVISNFIGTDVNGTTALGNTRSGMRLEDGASGNSIGSYMNSTHGNVISANGGTMGYSGIDILNPGTSNNVIEGNFIGTDHTGMVAIPNTGNGVSIFLGATGNQIGAMFQNVISGNTMNGVWITDQNTDNNSLRGNIIGLDANRNSALPNNQCGVLIENGAQSNTFGLSATNANYNYIAGNLQDGIWVRGVGTNMNIIESCHIGPNNGNGIHISNNAQQTQIGNTSGYHHQNSISYNTGHGIFIDNSQSNKVISVGGSLVMYPNTIFNNGGDGICVIGAASVNNTFSQNLIYNNGGLDIDLGNDGITANDPNDPDLGPNLLLNFPDINGAFWQPNGIQGTTTISGTIDIDTNPSQAIVELFWVSASCSTDVRYIVNVTPDAAGNWSVTLTSPGSLVPYIGSLILATTTDMNGNTSEFCPGITVIHAPQVVFDFGDAPEGALAYPSTGVIGQFPTCMGTGSATWIQSGGFAWFGPGGDSESDGNAGFCPAFSPSFYNSDETYDDGDAGLSLLEAYNIIGNPGVEKVVPMVGLPHLQMSLGNNCTQALWGNNIDLDVWNGIPNNAIAYVNVLIDWDQNGAWGGSSSCSGGQPVPEHVLVNFQVPNAFNGLISSLNPPGFLVGPNPGYVWARFTVTDQPIIIPWDGSGIFTYGETEDYLLFAGECDFGDAPDPSYPTYLTSNGAYHFIDGVTYMGNLIDGEPDGQPDPNAQGDDNANLIDEDGVVFSSTIVPGSNSSIQVTASVAGKLNAWIDFNIDGDWADAGEQICTDAPLGAGLNTVAFTVPSGAILGNTFSRFRFNTAGGLSYTGLATDGEVEDYMITIVNPSPSSWAEGFESYPLGADIVGLGGWEFWGDAAASDNARVTNAQVYSGTNALKIKGLAAKDGGKGVADDILHQYTGCNSGVWLFKTWQYIPTEAASGETYIILLNQYDHNDTTNNWSTQIKFDPDNNVVESDFDGTTLPLVKDAWVEVKVIVDLDNNLQSIYYDNKHLISKSWTEGLSGGGSLNIAAINLYAHTLENVDVYYDELSLEQISNQPLTIFTGWSGISSNLNLEISNVEALLGAVSNDVIFMRNLSGMYWPGQSINTLINWDTASGYVIKVSNDIALHMYGDELSGRTIYLNVGWNLIPAYSEVDAMAFLGSLPGFVLAKGVATSEILWPAYNIHTLLTLYPGKSYYVYMTQTGTITFPAGNTKASNPMQIPQIVSTPWNDYQVSPSTHIVAFKPACLDVLKPGDILGAFTENGKCAGSVTLTDGQKSLTVALMADDPTTEAIDGFTTGEQISWKWYNASDGKTSPLSVSYDYDLGCSNGFEANGLSVATGLTSTGLETLSGLSFNLYPNPSNGTFTIDANYSRAKIYIFNAFGKEIINFEMRLPGNIDLSAQPNGIYLVKIVSENGIDIQKLVIE